MVKSNTLQTIKDYMKFRMQSVNAHGLHSPFMYRLATECFYDKTKFSEYKLLKNYYKQLAQDQRNINVDDLGAGSKKFSSKNRKVADISKVSGSSYKEMKFLFRLSRYFQPKNVLELGTSLGKSAFSLALGNPNASIITVEGSKSVFDITKEYFEKNHIKNIELINADFDDFINGLTSRKFDFIYLDGNHRLKPTLNYFERLLPFIHNDTIVLLDDIYWSNEMKTAWNQLKKHPQVRQSIDTFHYGFLFFRKEQFLQHFYIRL